MNKALWWCVSVVYLLAALMLLSVAAPWEQSVQVGIAVINMVAAAVPMGLLAGFGARRRVT